MALDSYYFPTFPLGFISGTALIFFTFPLGFISGTALTFLHFSTRVVSWVPLAFSSLFHSGLPRVPQSPFLYLSTRVYLGYRNHFPSHFLKIHCISHFHSGIGCHFLPSTLGPSFCFDFNMAIHMCYVLSVMWVTNHILLHEGHLCLPQGFEAHGCERRGAGTLGPFLSLLGNLVKQL